MAPARARSPAASCEEPAPRGRVGGRCGWEAAQALLPEWGARKPCALCVSGGGQPESDSGKTAPRPRAAPEALCLREDRRVSEAYQKH